MEDTSKRDFAKYDRITLRCTVEEKEQMKKWARADNRSLSSYILHVCKQWEKRV